MKGRLGVIVLVVGLAILHVPRVIWGGTVALPPPSFAALVKHLTMTVVHISTSEAAIRRQVLLDTSLRSWQETTPDSPDAGGASGVIVSPEGYILTTNHTLPADRPLTVTLTNQQRYPAQIVGRDQPSDLALLRIRADAPLSAAPLGDSHPLQVGEWVLALANPFGLGGHATAGIISAVGRVIGHSVYDDFIQTDAAITPGNAGGPLISMRGEVIGINTALWRDAQHIGFAVPSNTVRTIYAQLRETGSVARGYLGVTGQRLSKEVATALGLSHTNGVLVVEIDPQGTAAEVGLRRGDVILQLAGEQAQDPVQLGQLMARQTIGARIELDIWRAGARVTFHVPVGTLPIPVTVPRERPTPQPLGLRLGVLSPELAARLHVPYQAGLIVEEVLSSSRAAQAGLQRGDVILEVNRRPVSRVDDFQRLYEAAHTPLLLFVRRGSTVRYTTLPPAS